MRIVAVYKESDSTLIASTVEVAETMLRRTIGLLGRKTLTEEQGLWIKPCSGVHTFGMAFPIDVVGLDRKCTVVRLWRALKPHRLTAVVPSVRSVIELPAGRIDMCFIRVGDQLHIEECEEE